MLAGHYEIRWPSQGGAFASPALCLLLGVNPDDWAGGHDAYVSGFVEPGQRDAVLAHLQAARATDASCVIEYGLQRADGAARQVVDVVWRNILDAARQDVLLTGVIIDVTEERAASHMVELMRSRLTEVARLTTLAEIAAGIAHELSQPLTAITTYASAAQRMLVDSRYSPFDVDRVLTDISAQALRSGETLQTLRHLIRHRITERSRLSSASLLIELVPLLRSYAQAHGMMLAVQPPATDLWIEADRLQVQHLLFHLVENAVQAMLDIRRSAGCVQVSGESLEGRMRYRVDDEGPGIGDDVARMLFRPFFSTKPNGTGLGLVVAEAIARHHGSRIEWANRPEGGARFWFDIDLVD